ncbi:hypothetical protein NE236_08160 [Actinoallomurus purpureus]|uniref:hypothetical protein n=1 Tax=Actinoallomurus purpureus TaxID=478114 RepID=UPI002092ABAF|nr:hypothetical protein [Actinoallomurus purpureus]MCO6004953.1 hypothetical protein [Actinoallomurus purpureus]
MRALRTADCAGKRIGPTPCSARADTEKDAAAGEVVPDSGGFSSEQQAIRIEDEGARRTPCRPLRRAEDSERASLMAESQGEA